MVSAGRQRAVAHYVALVGSGEALPLGLQRDCGQVCHAARPPDAAGCGRPALMCLSIVSTLGSSLLPAVGSFTTSIVACPSVCRRLRLQQTFAFPKLFILAVSGMLAKCTPTVGVAQTTTGRLPRVQ
ncbi:unnamed protein product [Ostreobium quekettii]|uniref:Uncharacterized protein n=1 Tax=Ostreobium quekettii TaxID=121088 RepID=A0A8S1J6H2_9CHLO|nr:unnamed protein product [Ostreobium quekettii]